MIPNATIRSFFLEGPAGRLEAILNAGAENPTHAAIVCHPHPLFGGTLHNKVVFHTMKALNAFGYPVLRFNFRGTGASAGEHDYGRGEIADVRVALDYLSEHFSAPILFAGFSFGAAIGLRAAVPHPRVHALISIGTPVSADGREYTYAMLQASPKPKLLLSGARDEFATPEQLEEIFASATEPKRLVLIPDADHFFTGRLDPMRTALSDWVREVLGSSSLPAV